MDKEASFTIEPESKAVDISQVGEQLGKEEDAPKGGTDWKHHSRTWEQRAKDSARKVKELEDALAAQSASTDTTDQLAALQAKVASLEADVAENCTWQRSRKDSTEKPSAPRTVRGIRGS